MIHLDDMTLADLRAEAQHLQRRGYGLAEMDHEDCQESPAVRRSLARPAQRSWSKAWRFTTPSGGDFALFADGGSQVVGLVSLRGERSRKTMDVRAATVLVSQV